jgi:hypothetical protein
MTTAMLSLPEAQSQVSTIGRNFTALVTPIIDQTIRGVFPPSDDDIYFKTVELLRAADRLIFCLRREHHDPDTDWANVYVTAQALRTAIYLNIIHFKPDQASYWSEETQVRLGSSYRGVDPSRVLPFISDEALTAAYTEMAADDEYEREALEWSKGLVGETLE